jgi:hypothetical protein
MPDVEIEKLLEDDLVQFPILSQDEGIVQARDEQNVVNAEGGQVGETG